MEPVVEWLLLALPKLQVVVGAAVFGHFVLASAVGPDPAAVVAGQ